MGSITKGEINNTKEAITAKLNNSLDDVKSSQKKSAVIEAADVEAGQGQVKLQSQESVAMYSHVDNCSSIDKIDDGSLKEVPQVMEETAKMD